MKLRNDLPTLRTSSCDGMSTDDLAAVFLRALRDLGHGDAILRLTRLEDGVRMGYSVEASPWERGAAIPTYLLRSRPEPVGDTNHEPLGIADAVQQLRVLSARCCVQLNLLMQRENVALQRAKRGQDRLVSATSRLRGNRVGHGRGTPEPHGGSGARNAGARSRRRTVVTKAHVARGRD